MPVRLNVRALVALMAVVSLDLAVLIRAYQHGRLAGSAGGYVAVFGLVLLLFNLGLVQLRLGLGRLRGKSLGERLSSRVPLEVMLVVYLMVLAVPILAILFLRPGTF
jgi:hypothetical protein